MAVLPARSRLEGERRPFVAEAVGQDFARDLLQGLDRLALGVAGRPRAIELGRRVEVVARHAVGAGNVAHGGEGAERHRAAARIADADVEHVLGFDPIGAIRLRDHAEGAAEQIEVVDIGRADIDLQRGEHVGRGDTQHLRLGAVDVEIELRRRRLEQGEHLRQPRRLPGARLPSRRRPLCSASSPRPARSSTIMRTPPALPMPCTGGGATTRINASWISERRLNNSPVMRARGLAWILGALVERREHGEDGAGIGRQRERRTGKADDVHRARNAGHLQRDLDGAPVDLVGARQRGAGRKLHDDDQVAAIERRDEAHGSLAELVEAEGDNAGIDHEHERGVAHDARRQPAIALPERVEASVEETEESAQRALPRARRAMLARLEQQRAQRGRERERDDQGDDGRAGDGERELPVELAGNSGDEARRHEHRTEHQRDRDQRRADLVHALDGGLARRQAGFDIALDVLDHDDGVVDHDADREHQPEQRSGC